MDVALFLLQTLTKRFETQKSRKYGPPCTSQHADDAVDVVIRDVKKRQMGLLRQDVFI